MELEIIMLREVNQVQKDKGCIFAIVGLFDGTGGGEKGKEDDRAISKYIASV
jgi:hypothetical protein